ncbi:MFS transporter [Streptomyces sp. RS10V-4]|uniref:MFS transporter n=1 Tax=Streptomyces rhizoryzae TaxID=2932493 RepID=UPI002003D67D|nr:MFS transporter [Streptomyces rhizoryzae]MCK7622828.1 MFS transporter [Streptomyces rhizoryzae]
MTAAAEAGAGGAAAGERAAGQAAGGRTAVRTVARRLLPLLFVLYVVNFLDRANIGVAALAMNAELHLSPTAYGTAAGIFFIGYLVFQVPAAWALNRFGARRWLAGVITAWGLCSAATAFVADARGLFLARFLLGLAEAGFFPGVVAYLTTWFPARRRTRALAAFLLAIPVATAIGLPTSGLLVEHAGLFGLSGWRSMFLIEGAPAVVLGIAALRLLPDAPDRAAWLSIAQRRELAAEVASDTPPDRTGGAVLGRVAHFALVQAGMAFAAYALQFFLPQVLTGLFPGVRPAGVAALAALPYVVAVPAMLLWSRHGDRAGHRASLITVPLAGSALAAAGAALSHLPVLTLTALTVMVAANLAAVPALWSRCTGALAGRHAATAIAGVNALANVASFAGPSVTGRLADATGGYQAVYAVMACVTATSWAAARRLPGPPAAPAVPAPAALPDGTAG